MILKLSDDSQSRKQKSSVCQSLLRVFSILIPEGAFTFALFYFDVIYQTQVTVSSAYPNTEKKVENTTRSEIFLTKFEVFG